MEGVDKGTFQVQRHIQKLPVLCAHDCSLRVWDLLPREGTVTMIEAGDVRKRGGSEADEESLSISLLLPLHPLFLEWTHFLSSACDWYRDMLVVVMVVVVVVVVIVVVVGSWCC